MTDIGQTVNSNGTATVTGNSVFLGNFPYTASYTIEAFDEVTVPAGAFSVVRVQETTDFGAESVSDTLYLARNIGVVKIVQTSGGSTVTAELTATNVTPGAAANDLNGDGKADLVWRHNGTGDVAAWLMDGSTVRTDAWFGPVDPGWQIVGVGDLDGDGKADIVWRNAQTGWVDLWFMDGANAPTGASVRPVADLQWEIQP